MLMGTTSSLYCRMSIFIYILYIFSVVVPRYTEHSTVGLAQQWDQLDQLGMRMQHNLEQQIQAWYVDHLT